MPLLRLLRLPSVSRKFREGANEFRLTRRRRPAELKLRLAEAYLNGEGSLKAIGKVNNIRRALLMIWVDKYRRGEITPEVDFVEKRRTYEAHAAALERKIGNRPPSTVLKCEVGVPTMVSTNSRWTQSWKLDTSSSNTAWPRSMQWVVAGTRSDSRTRSSRSA